MRHVPLVLSALALCSALSAQRLASYTSAGAVVAEMQPPTQLLPGPIPPLVMYPQVPAMPALGFPAGDSTFNNRTGYHWFTNGALMVPQMTPTFPPVVAPPAPFPIPLPVLAMIGGGPVTGIALDVAANVMYLTGVPGIVVGCTPIAGMPVVVPPFPLAFPTGPISGLEWDAMTGTLIACDIPGVCYTFFPVTGLPAAFPIVPPGALPGPAGDVALDRTLRLNGFGLRPLYLAAGPAILDVNMGLAMFFPGGPGPMDGLAFINHPAANPPAGACNCPGTNYPIPFTTGPMSIGNPAWGIGVGGLPPGWPVLFAFDFAFLPGFPIVNTVGCGLGLTALPVVFGAAANAMGNAIMPLALVPPVLPLGAGPFYNQNFTLCAADAALGLVLTPTQMVHVASW